MGKACAALRDYCNDPTFSAKLLSNCRRSCGVCGPCALRPCKNGGLCVATIANDTGITQGQSYDALGHFECKCLIGFGGLDCSLAISPCLGGGILACGAAKLCKNNRTAPGGFTCESPTSAPTSPTASPTASPTGTPQIIFARIFARTHASLHARTHASLHAPPLV